MAVFKGLDTEASSAAGWRRACAVAGLASLAGGLVAVAMTAQPASPLRIVAPVSAAGVELSRAESLRLPACGDTFEGSVEREEGFQIQRRLGDGARLCARMGSRVRLDSRSGAIRELPAGSSVWIETRASHGGSQRMLVTREQGELRYQWWLNGASQPLDAAARAWLDDALAVVAADREIGAIEGEVGGLQGEIGAIEGQIGGLQGQIGSIQGEIGALQGRIGSIQGERGGLEGEIGGHQGAIGGLEASRWNASSARVRQIDTQIQQHEAAIRKLEQQLESGAFRQRLTDAEAELSTFEQSSRGRIDELERQIEAIRREDAASKLEKQIEELHADDRIDAIKRRVAPTVERLSARVVRLGR